MAYTISDDCSNCGACVDSCPIEAIAEKDGKHQIDSGSCSDCGVCVDSCPLDAISAG